MILLQQLSELILRLVIIGQAAHGCNIINFFFILAAGYSNTLDNISHCPS